MQQSKTKYFLILASIFLSQKNYSMEQDDPKIIYNPVSLKMLAGLTLIKNGNITLPAAICEEIKEYVQFIKENFIPAGSGFCMHGPTINNAILSNRYEIIPDLAQILRYHDKIHLLNIANLPEERTPLLFAVEKEDIQLTCILLAAGANPNTPWPVTTQTPLILAVEKGNIPLVELLIKYNADIEQKNRIDGYTPLMEAARTGQLEMVKILLKNGASKNSENKRYGCAASISRNNGHQAIYELVATPEYTAIVASIEKILGLS